MKAHHNSPAYLAQGAIHGYVDAIWVAVGILVVSAVLSYTLITVGREAVAPVTGGIGEEIGDVVPMVMH